METKANPGVASCYASALPDEPMFVLLARDRCAPSTIRFWADQRAQMAVEEGGSQDTEQLTEALESADIMEAWRVEHDGAWRNHPLVSPAHHADVPRDELASIAGKILARSVATGLARTAMPADTSGKFVGVEAFNSLLADAKKLAGFVLNADPAPGPNRG